MATRNIPDTAWFEYHNENPKGRIASDCVIRAIATATGKSWDDVLDGLVEVSHKYKVIPNEPKCYGCYLESLGFVKMKQPRKSDNTKYTGKQFCDWMRTNGIKNPIVANIGGGHVTVFMPGKCKVLDIWDCTSKTIGNYWIKERIQK